ncbi:hypothetical protein IVB69_02330 [Flavobacterium sp. J49]|uniref:hypothetical protein n=1 Tax=Flavobacterium sp. J49 TaxID=2718534 RepID=UPI0015935C5A|nr:hypothetical protein [Flavobacterium sp. J49]MBF6640243.1 hypothetical protein [Flavobacterium sp. J49]MBF6640309.1 hypothetical protein [Flavobacterium sp. J49]NIC01488.1 hypothetical protein [Flavobacterium sp. J49]NIC01554.1 hypothetical protein [Flavobacterium sp. J49]
MILFFRQALQTGLLKMYFQSEDAKRLAKVTRKKLQSQILYHVTSLTLSFCKNFNAEILKNCTYHPGVIGTIF